MRVLLSVVLLALLSPVANAVESLFLQPVVTSGLSSPLYVTSPPNDYRRLFIVERGGQIRIVKDGSLLPTPYLNIATSIISGGEQGLLGLAFAPGFATSGHFWVYFTDRVDNIDYNTLARFTAAGNPMTSNTADPASRVDGLRVMDPYSNHNGGMLAFDPDGHLYVALGDGGSGGDPLNSGQTLTSLLGKILRLAPDAAGATPGAPGNPFGNAPRVWAYGLRNPWRFSFDRETGDMWIGDVGQNQREEIDLIPAGSGGGQNFGWRVFEGTACYATTEECEALSATATPPVYEYEHGDTSASVTGGYVYRGTRAPSAYGRYFFRDVYKRRLLSFEYNGNVPVNVLDVNDMVDPTNTILRSVVSFGEDARGELYIVNIEGQIHRLEQACPRTTFTIELTPSADATLYEPIDQEPGNANGAGPTLFAGVTAAGLNRRALLRFPVQESLPAGAEVQAAELRLTLDREATGDGGTTMALHRVSTAWSEGVSDAGLPGGVGVAVQTGDVNWGHATYDVTPWNTPGGDFEPGPSATAAVDDPGQYTIAGNALRDDVVAWLEGDTPNNGWMLIGDESSEQNARRYISREGAAASRPALRITYTLGETACGAGHTTDQSGDGRINLSELLRAIQLFNSGELHCAPGTEDNYAPGPGDRGCTPYSVDYNPQDWQIDLSELLRVIQLFNAGNYRPCLEGEDGFCLDA